MPTRRARITPRLSSLLGLALCTQHALCMPLLASAPLSAFVALLGSVIALALGVIGIRNALAPLDGLAVKLRAIARAQELPQGAGDARVKALGAELSPVVVALTSGITTSGDLRARAAEASGHKNELLRSLRHELRTPLNAILGFSDVLLGGLEGPLTEDQRESLNVIRRSAGKLGELFDHVLELSLLAGNEQAVVRRELDATTLVDSVAEALEARRGDRLVHVKREVEGEAHGFVGDATRLTTLLESLGRHVLDHVKGPLIVVGARVEPQGAQELLTLYVRDPSGPLARAELQAVLGTMPDAGGKTPTQRSGTRALFALLRELTTVLGCTLETVSDAELGTVHRLRVPASPRSAA